MGMFRPLRDSEFFTGDTRTMGRFPVFILLMALALGILGGGYQAMKGTHTPSLWEATRGFFSSFSIQTATKEDSKRELPLPRFVSLKSGRANVRRGPSYDQPIVWVYTAKDLPIEILGEYNQWRRIRDSEGAEGWMYQGLLSSRRTAIVAPWKDKNAVFTLKNAPNETAQTVARVQSGVWGRVGSCTGKWCEITIAPHEGWIEQTLLFGVYPNEILP